MDVHYASLGDSLPSASGYALPITRLMSDALSRLQKFSGTCTPAALAAEPPSWEHPHAAAKTTATATPNSKQRLTGLSERDTAVGIVRSLQHPDNQHPRDKRRGGFNQRDAGSIIRLFGSNFQPARSICIFNGFICLTKCGSPTGALPAWPDGASSLRLVTPSPDGVGEVSRGVGLQIMSSAGEHNGVVPGHKAFPATAFLGAKRDISVPPDDQGRHVGQTLETVFEVGKKGPCGSDVSGKDRAWIAPSRGR